MTLVLVVDDDETIRIALSEELTAAGYEAVAAADTNSALALFDSNRPDIVLTDLGMPGADGFTLVAELRKRSDTVPILVVSVRGREQDKVRALDLGADDYIVKPFAVGELLARVRAQARRAGASTRVFRFAGLTVDLERRLVTQGNRDIRLTPIEFALLEVFVSNSGRPLTLDRLISRVWPQASGTAPDTVRVHVGSLRRKIEPDPSNPRYIVTEPWIGYRFVGEPN